MTVQERRAYIREVARRYKKAPNRKNKTALITEVVENTRYHRKRVIRLLNDPPLARCAQHQRRRVRKYDNEVIAALLIIWKAADYMCASLLYYALQTHVERLEKFGHLRIDARVKGLLREISRSTLERILEPHKHLRPAGRNTPRRQTRARLEREIAVEVLPEPAINAGKIDVDTVQHDGGDPSGRYGCTVNCIDRATYWSYKETIYGRRPENVIDVFRAAREQMPMNWEQLHFDGGGEFNNWRVVNWCKAYGIPMTRGRAYRSNDNARNENSNRYQIRRNVGRGRVDEPARIELLNKIWVLEDKSHNFFHPVKKLISTSTVIIDEVRHRKKTYDTPRTPYERALDDPTIAEETKCVLRAIYAQLDPLALVENRYRLIHTL